MSVDNGKIGDWNRVEKMLASFGSRFQQNIQQATDRSGRILEAAMVSRIEQQKLSPPLKPKYKRWKIGKGYSEQILVMTGTLMQNIRYHRHNWSSGFVGVLRNVKHSSGPSLVNIAAVHEYGTRDGRVPARPYMAPALKESEAQIRRQYEDAIERTFK
jgi:phage gpG-like protein